MRRLPSRRLALIFSEAKRIHGSDAIMVKKDLLEVIAVRTWKE
jgi:hypothetical protein